MPLTPRTAPPPRQPLSDAMHYQLMIGDLSGARLHGWVALWETNPQRDFETALAESWAEHGAALIAEAAAFGFEPWMVGRQRPTGDGVTRWRQQFIAQHRY
jgi:hypothetical protein